MKKIIFSTLIQSIVFGLLLYLTVSSLETILHYFIGFVALCFVFVVFFISYNINKGFTNNRLKIFLSSFIVVVLSVIINIILYNNFNLIKQDGSKTIDEKFESEKKNHKEGRLKEVLNGFEHSVDTLGNPDSFQ